MKPRFLALSFTLGAICNALGQTPAFATIDYPGAASTQAWGIEKSGIIGLYTTPDKVTHGFLLREGRFTSIDFPGASSTLANGINTKGDIVAEYTLSGTLHGLLLSGGNSITIDAPGATGTEPIGINARGDIVGDYTTADKVTHGFLLSGDVFTTIDYPGSSTTILQSINRNGDIVGGYSLNGVSHGVLYANGAFTSFDAPGATFTTATGINERGDIVGRYTASGVNHAYLLHNGQFTTIDYPGATYTGATAITPRGDILGRYTAGGVGHGFLLSRAGRYTVVDLGPLSYASHVTANRLVSGYTTPADNTWRAALWQDGLVTDISTPGLGGKNSEAFAVNKWGQVVGEAETRTADPNGEDFCGFQALGLATAGTTCVPFLWKKGVMNALPTLGGPNGSISTVNDEGIAVGYAENATKDPSCTAPQVLQFRPAVWAYGQVQELPVFPGDSEGIALGVNNQGVVTGTSGTCAPFNPASQVYLTFAHALIWRNGQMTDLGNLGGAGTFLGNSACAVNSHGQVVGQSDLPGDSTGHAFIWENGVMNDLGPYPGDAASLALGVGEDGEVVGLSLDPDFNLRAMVWDNGIPVDLNSISDTSDSGLYLALAESLNSRGEIVGFALTSDGEMHAYLAMPNSSDSAVAQSVTKRPALSENARKLVQRRLRLRQFAR